MSKYIIKNCPAYCYLGKECHNEEGQYGASCCEITDCAMKQIVEKCMENWEDMTTDRFQRELLDLLDIQECEG